MKAKRNKKFIWSSPRDAKQNKKGLQKCVYLLFLEFYATKKAKHQTAYAMRECEQ
jgi:hypothetical protein